MRKIIKLSESDLTKIVKRVLNESKRHDVLVERSIIVEVATCTQGMGGGTCTDEKPSCVVTNMSTSNPGYYCCPDNYEGDITKCSPRGTFGVKNPPVAPVNTKLKK